MDRRSIEGKAASLRYEPDDMMRSWISGERFRNDSQFPGDKEPAVPIRVDIEPGSEEEPLLDFYPAPIVLMSKRLVTVIKKAGVKNIDCYETRIFNPLGRMVSKAYFAVNVIGKVRAADILKSISGQLSFGPKFLMFNLEESNYIVVHEHVKKAVEKADFPTVIFYDLRNSNISELSKNK